MTERSELDKRHVFTMPMDNDGNCGQCGKSCIDEIHVSVVCPCGLVPEDMCDDGESRWAKCPRGQERQAIQSKKAKEAFALLYDHFHANMSREEFEAMLIQLAAAPYVSSSLAKQIPDGPLYHVINGWPQPHLEKDCPYCAAYAVPIPSAPDKAMAERVIAYLHSTNLEDQDTTCEKVLNDAMGIPTDADRAFVSAPAARECSDSAMLENYAQSYDGMGYIEGPSVAFDIRHNMIPALASSASGYNETKNGRK